MKKLSTLFFFFLLSCAQQVHSMEDAVGQALNYTKHRNGKLANKVAEILAIKSANTGFTRIHERNFRECIKEARSLVGVHDTKQEKFDALRGILFALISFNPENPSYGYTILTSDDSDSNSSHSDEDSEEEVIASGDSNQILVAATPQNSALDVTHVSPTPDPWHVDETPKEHQGKSPYYKRFDFNKQKNNTPYVPRKSNQILVAATPQNSVLDVTHVSPTPDPWHVDETPKEHQGKSPYYQRFDQGFQGSNTPYVPVVSGRQSGRVVPVVSQQNLPKNSSPRNRGSNLSMELDEKHFIAAILQGNNNIRQAIKTLEDTICYLNQAECLSMAAREKQRELDFQGFKHWLSRVPEVDESSGVQSREQSIDIKEKQSDTSRFDDDEEHCDNQDYQDKQTYDDPNFSNISLLFLILMQFGTLDKIISHCKEVLSLLKERGKSAENAQVCWTNEGLQTWTTGEDPDDPIESFTTPNTSSTTDD